MSTGGTSLLLFLSRHFFTLRRSWENS